MNPKHFSSLRLLYAAAFMALVVLVAMPHTAKAQSSFSFFVQKEGHGPAMILLPGLYSSGDVWKETVAHFKNRYTCYSLTLPGFAGQPPLASDTILSAVAAQIVRFIQQNGLQKPVIVGHSLGGWLALKVATLQPNILGGVVCVSSGPFLPGLAMGNDISLDSTRSIGVIIKRYMSASTPEQTRQSQQQQLPTMMRDSIHMAQVLDMAMRSDAATQGEVMYELFSSDLRPEMHKITCPILVLGDWASYKSYGATRENVTEKYRQQFAGAPHVTIALNDTSKHFIMYDEPVWMFGQMDKFLVR